jgi:hypothetical protein
MLRDGVLGLTEGKPPNRRKIQRILNLYDPLIEGNNFRFMLEYVNIGCRKECIPLKQSEL